MPIRMNNRKELRIAMRRPTSLSSIKKISSSINRSARLRKSTLDEAIKSMLDEYFKKLKIGLFRIDNDSKRNLLYAAFRAKYIQDQKFHEEILQRYLHEIYDHRIIRYVIIKSIQIEDYALANAFIKHLNSDKWKKYNNKKIIRHYYPEALKEKRIEYQNISYEPKLKLSESAIIHTHIVNDDSTDLILIGKLEGHNPDSYNGVLTSFIFLNNQKQEVKNIEKQSLTGISYSNKVGFYSYLRTNDNGYFFIRIQLPDSCKIAQLYLRTWANPKGLEPLLIKGLYALDFRQETCLRASFFMFHHINKWFEGNDWNNFIFEIYVNLSFIFSEMVSSENLEEWITKLSTTNIFEEKSQLVFSNKIQFISEYSALIRYWPKNKNSFLSEINELQSKRPDGIMLLPLFREIIKEKIHNHSRNFTKEILRHVEDEIRLTEEPPQLGLIMIRANLFLKMGEINSSLKSLVQHRNHPSAHRKVKAIEEQLELLNEEFTVKRFDLKKYKPSDSIVYLLHNSLPYHNAGYACRSQGLISNLIDLGVDIMPLSRHCYPWDWKEFKQLPLIKSEIVSGVRYHRTHQKGESLSRVGIKKYLENYAHSVIKFAQKNTIGIVHAASNYRNGIAGIIAAKNLNIASIYEVRGFWEITRISREPEWQFSEQFKFEVKMETEACRLSDHVLTLNNSMKKELINRGIPSEKISIIPNGVDCKKFQPTTADESLIISLGLENKFVIGYIGSIVSYEGLDLLIDAINLLVRVHPQVHALIVGDGAELDNLINKVEELGLERYVTFTGRVDHSEVNRYYSVMQTMAFPRKSLPVTELVTPLKPFEAMAMGICIICSSVNALSEFVIIDTNGILFEKDNSVDLASKIEALLYTNKSIEIGLFAREWVMENRDWSTISNKLKMLYARLL